MGKRGPKPKERCITQQHIDILHFIAKGFTDREIAEEMTLDYYFVKDRIQEIYLLLRARNRAHAAAIGVRDGLVSGGAA